MKFSYDWYIMILIRIIKMYCSKSVLSDTYRFHISEPTILSVRHRPPLVIILGSLICSTYRYLNRLARSIFRCFVPRYVIIWYDIALFDNIIMLFNVIVYRYNIIWVWCDKRLWRWSFDEIFSSSLAGGFRQQLIITHIIVDI